MNTPELQGRRKPGICTMRVGSESQVKQSYTIKGYAKIESMAVLGSRYIVAVVL